MIIYANSKTYIPASSIVNRVGKYLYQHIDGAFKFNKSSNMCDVYFLLLYQVPRPYQIPGRQREGYNDMHEMNVNVNITTYQNKIRVNVTEVTPEERTLGFDVYNPELLDTIGIEALKDKIYDKVCRRIEKAYKDYDFAF